MGRILRKVQAFAGQNKSGDEYEELLDIWTETLWKAIPENRLDAAYSRAVELHKSNFAINGFDLLNAYREIQAEEMKAAATARLKQAADATADYNSPYFKPCEFCSDSGFRRETRRFEGLDVKGVVKCYGCNHWERHKLKHNL